MTEVRTVAEVPVISGFDAEVVKVAVGRFWQGQSRLLDDMLEFTVGWFDRRHIGIQAALAATAKACEVNALVDVIATYQEWVSGAAARILEDEIALQKFVSSVTSRALAAGADLDRQVSEQARQANLLPQIWAAA